MATIRLYKVWGSNQNEPMLIWARHADEAFFGIGRILDPTVVSTQWTGEEKEVSPEEAERVVRWQLKSFT